MIAHHAVAYFVDDYTTPSEALPQLRAEYEVEVYSAPTLAISEVRRIIQSAHNRPFEKDYKVIYLATGHIGVPAQNALLKILEEPPSTTKFVLWLGQQVELLPTVRSRVHIAAVPSAPHTTDTEAVFTAFRSEAVPDRLARVAAIYKAKDTAADQQLYSGLTTYLTTTVNQLSDTARKDLLTLHSQLHGPGASKKMLWEAIAFLVPVE